MTKIIDIIGSLNSDEVDRIIEMAWEDRTPFDAIESQFGINESQVIKLMQRELKESSWKRWRKRVHGRQTKHAKLLGLFGIKHKCHQQRQISLNKIPKR